MLLLSSATRPKPCLRKQPDGVKGGEAQRFVRDLDIPGQWWTLFHSKPLDDLIVQAIKANPDMEGAQAALKGAWENVYAQQGAFFPSVDANINPTRQKISDAVTSPLANNSNVFNLHTAQVSVAYTPDVFGGNRRQVESLKAQADWQRFQLEATYLTLTSNVVATAVGEAAIRGQITATKRIIEIQSKTLDLMQSQFTLGQVAVADVAAQEAELAQSQAMLPPLEKQLAQQRDSLARLIGRFPSDTITEQFELSSLQLPQELPVSLPSKLVSQRPDIRAAEEQLHAASAEIGISVANRLPNITLSAKRVTCRFDRPVVRPRQRLLDPGRQYDTTDLPGGDIAAPSTRRRSGLRPGGGAVSHSVLCFQNVAETLHAIQSDADALKAAFVAERAAAKSLSIVRSQLELGDVGPLALLNAEQTYQQAMINYVQALANRYADTAALFQALGGGWWNRSDVAAGVGG